MSDPVPALPTHPPSKSAPPTESNVHQLQVWLDSITAFGTYTAGRPWRFYEEVDAYLGPWGMEGYPIAYGKKYCILFSTDRRLQQSGAGRAWVRRTLILLQVALKNYILARFRAGTLGSVTAQAFQQAAFDSHPQAYTEGGLTMVAMLDPALIGHVALIPAAEFNPASPTFIPTLSQVIVTAGLMVPESVGIVLAGAAGPAHTGVLARAFRRDAAQLQRLQSLGRALSEIRLLLSAGRLDHVGLLERLAESLATARWPDDGLARLAREVCTEILLRRSFVMSRYRHEAYVDPSLLEIYRMFDARGL